MEEIVRREFRAPSLYGNGGGGGGGDAGKEARPRGTAPPPLSSKYPDSIRRATAFLALRELNKKLTFAENLGMDLLGGRDFDDDDDDGDGGDDPIEESVRADRRLRNRNRLIRNRRQAARGFSVLPTVPPSSYLRPGAYLVAHPLMPGYFARTVIVLLDHTPPARAEVVRGDVDTDEGEGEDERRRRRRSDDDDDRPSLPSGPYKLELLEEVQGWCWLTGGESTAYVHRVVESLWADDGTGTGRGKRYERPRPTCAAMAREALGMRRRGGDDGDGDDDDDDDDLAFRRRRRG
uniref:Uncharacterized protein n=1 Tax=Odontella aurita TaxID=265563 RepID=A0A7S4J863_9STRA